jgi:photosynthetic reaction center H subunit
MQTGAISGTIDVAQLTLIAFFLFFIFLVRYLQRESNREGFPLRDQDDNIISTTGLSGVPDPKAFVLKNGDVVLAPRNELPELPVNAAPIANFPGAPLEAIGNKLLSNTGPAAWARRADTPDRRFHDDAPKIVPMRADPTLSVALEDHDPRGWNVTGNDDLVAGTVSEVWVDRSENTIRYLEVALVAELGARHVLLPFTMVNLYGKNRIVKVDLLLAAQLADIPPTKTPDIVTLLEEDQIQAYVGGGLLYATPARAEPLI